MFKIFSIMAQALRAEAEPSDTPIWLRDPLSHPDIATMDSRALGDLPFSLFRLQAQPSDICPARCAPTV